MKASPVILVLAFAGLAIGAPTGRLGPFKVHQMEPGISNGTGNYIVQFFLIGTVSAGGCESIYESKLIAPGGISAEALRIAAAWDGDLMNAYLRNADIWVTFTGSYCNASALDFGP